MSPRRHNGTRRTIVRRVSAAIWHGCQTYGYVIAASYGYCWQGDDKS